MEKVTLFERPERADLVMQSLWEDQAGELNFAADLEHPPAFIHPPIRLPHKSHSKTLEKNQHKKKALEQRIIESTCL